MRCTVKWWPYLRSCATRGCLFEPAQEFWGVWTYRAEKWMQIYTTEFVTNHMARTTPRSREDLVAFTFKLNQFPHPFVKLNHFFSHTSSPMDSDDHGQWKEQPTGTKSYWQPSLVNTAPFMKRRNLPSFPAFKRLLHPLKVLFHFSSALPN